MSSHYAGPVQLPPYTYVPGFAPHPISDADGHLQEVNLPESMSQMDHLLWGKRLFDAGYYWEAHEAWEHLWLELGRTSPEALTVKGLIKLAASGVKCREGNAAGAKRHATRAVELLEHASTAKLFNGVNLRAACQSARQMAEAPPVGYVDPSGTPVSLPGLTI